MQYIFRGKNPLKRSVIHPKKLPMNSTVFLFIKDIHLSHFSKTRGEPSTNSRTLRQVGLRMSDWSNIIRELFVVEHGLGPGFLDASPTLASPHLAFVPLYHFGIKRWRRTDESGM